MTKITRGENHRPRLDRPAPRSPKSSTHPFRPITNDGPPRRSAAQTPVVIACAAVVIVLVLGGVGVLFGGVVNVKHSAAAVPGPATKPIAKETAAETNGSTAACEELAPSDPYQKDQEAGDRAFAACQQAAMVSPDDAETQFRLGLAALQADRFGESVDILRRAESLGHCGALGYLGDAAWFGAGNADAAEEYYTRGKACGDTRSAHAVFSQEMFAKSGYPALIEALYRSDIRTLNEQRFFAASYVAGFYKELGDQYLSEHFSTCWAERYFSGGRILYQIEAAEKGDASNPFEGLGYEKVLPWVFTVLIPEMGTKALEEIRRTTRESGRSDVYRLVGGTECGGLVPYRIVQGIEAFAPAKRSLLRVLKERYPEIRTLDDIKELPWRQGARPAQHQSTP